MARPRTTTPRKPDDARAHRSVEALRVAFLALIETRPLDQVTIRDITEAAGVSYPTFFRRFAGKDELLADIATTEVRHLLVLGQGGGRHGSSLAMCEYLAAHRRLWRTLLTGGAAAAMREEFMAVSREIATTGPRINPWIPVDLAVPFVAGGLFEILAWWMRQPDDYPTANVATLLDALVIDVTARPRPITLA
ncbi:MAG: TetR/AcrR family transcriptional regulator [Sphingomonadales bacterium]|nr:TetR/AcrR family transcriptional regulator [Sphingomonadales bacterium]